MQNPGNTTQNTRYNCIAFNFMLLENQNRRYRKMYTKKSKFVFFILKKYKFYFFIYSFIY